MSQNFTLSFFALKISRLFCFFASFHFHTLFSHRSEKNFASVSLHFASKQKLRQFRFFFVSFSLCFIFVSLQISTFRIDAKQAKNSLFFASKRKKFRFRFASFLFEAKMTAHPTPYHSARLSDACESKDNYITRLCNGICTRKKFFSKLPIICFFALSFRQQRVTIFTHFRRILTVLD